MPKVFSCSHYCCKDIVAIVSRLKCNIKIARLICNGLDRKFPNRAPHYNLIKFVPDRLGHDFRYAVDGEAMIKSFNWKPKIGFRDGLRDTIEWYVKNLGQKC